MHSILENCTKHVPIAQATTDQILGLIANSDKNPNTGVIREIRKTGDKETHKFKLGCFTPNAYFTDYVSTADVTSASGYVYIDLDAKDGFDKALHMDILGQNPHVYAAWTSVTGSGIGCLFKAHWCDTNTFLSAYDVVHSTLIQQGVNTLYIDKKCRDIARLNFISLCEDMYRNPEAISITKPRGLLHSVISYPFCNRSKQPLDALPLAKMTRIKYKTELDDWADDETVRLIPEGKDYVRIYVGQQTIKKGERNRSLFRVGCAIICLNPDLSTESLAAHLWAVNRRMCEIPLPPHEVNEVAQSITNTAKEGGVYTFVKKKKVWFRADSRLTPREKQSVSAQLIGKLRSENTLELLRDCIRILREHDIPVTRKKVAQVSGKSFATVKSYWKQLKEDECEK